MLIFTIAVVGDSGGFGDVVNGGFGSYRSGLGGAQTGQAFGDGFAIGIHVRGFGDSWGGDRGAARRRYSITRSQDHAIVLDFRLNPALNFPLGNAVQHGGIGSGRFSAKVAVFCGQITEIFGDRLHGVERLIEPFQRAAESSIRYGKNFTCTDHRDAAFTKFTSPTCTALCSIPWTEQGNLKD